MSTRNDFDAGCGTQPCAYSLVGTADTENIHSNLRRMFHLVDIIYGIIESLMAFCEYMSHRLVLWLLPSGNPSVL